MLQSLFSDFFGQIGALDSIRVTVIMSFSSTAISSVIGIALAFWLERHEFPGKRVIIRINRTLMGVPPVVVGLVVYMLLMRRGPLGFLGWLFSIRGMIFAQILIITPIICGTVYSAAARNVPVIRNFGKTMGVGRRHMALLILKEMKNEIYFAIITGYGRSISEVGAVFLVGGNIKNATRTMTTTISTLKSAGIFTDGIILGVMLLIMAFILQSLADLLRNEKKSDENY